MTDKMREYANATYPAGPPDATKIRYDVYCGADGDCTRYAYPVFRQSFWSNKEALELCTKLNSKGGAFYDATIHRILPLSSDAK